VKREQGNFVSPPVLRSEKKERKTRYTRQYKIQGGKTKMKKYLAVAAVVALVALAAPAFAATNPFMDVPINHWSYDAIGQLAARGVLSGYPDGTYKGKQPTTR
jgi:hypothetical protein